MTFINVVWQCAQGSGSGPTPKMKQPKAQIMGSLQLKALTFPEVSEVLKALFMWVLRY